MKRAGKFGLVLAVMAVGGGVWLLLWSGKGGGGRGGLGEGERLARLYCSGCHVFPEPEVLDRESWRAGVLPEMGRYLGIQDSEFRIENSEGGAEEVKEVARVSEGDWKGIVDFYLGRSREGEIGVGSRSGSGIRIRSRSGSKVGSESGGEVEGVTEQFGVRRLEGYERRPPMTCMVRVVEKSGVRSEKSEWEGSLLCVGDGMSRSLEALQAVTKGKVSKGTVSSGWGVERVFGVGFDSGAIWVSYGGSPEGGAGEGGSAKGGAGGWLDVLTVGRLFPSDLERGRLIRIQDSEVRSEGAGVRNGDGEGVRMETLLRGLRRPVHFARGDLNGDGLEDFVVCEFGNRQGRMVCWMQRDGHKVAQESQRGEVFEEVVLWEEAGAIRCELRDMDGDGDLDVVGLMGQGREGVYLFQNSGVRVQESEGKGVRLPVFERVALVEEHPAFGFSYFELVDFDGDGDVDLLTTNGDRGELFGGMKAAPLKGYHGVRVYVNEGSEGGSRGGVPVFRERWFFQMHGAYGARAADFDLDGDLDVAAISYFPDFYGSYGGSASGGSPDGSPNGGSPGSPGFVYLENRGNWEFGAWRIKEERAGRWMVMDAGDLDGDGDRDIVLGSLVVGPTSVPVPARLMEEWRRNGPAVLVLENLER